jgi:hypothetical protein
MFGLCVIPGMKPAVSLPCVDAHANNLAIPSWLALQIAEAKPYYCLNTSTSFMKLSMYIVSHEAISVAYLRSPSS